MDIISELPDHLLLRILSFVQTKTVFDAHVLSKRWKNLWRTLPSLYYDYASHKTESQFSEFIEKTMELLESPVLDSLYLRLAPTATSLDDVVKQYLLAKKPVRKLELVSTHPGRSLLNKGMYQFQALVILRLERFCLEEDDYGSPISSKSIKVLQLCHVKYSSDESLSNILSSLPSLEDLILDQCLSVNPAKTLSIAVPCLQRLTVLRCPDSCRNKAMMLIVNAPSLKYLNVEEYWRKVSFSDENMKELVEANVNVTYVDTEKLLRTLISVKRLSLCLISRVNIFYQLVHLEICTCQHEWWNLLDRVLLDSPRLRVLKLHQKHCFGLIDPTVRWKEPSFVPECFASHLETFEWRDYEGTEEEKELVRYILRNALRLQIATIYPLISHPDKRMHQKLRIFMHKELKNLSRCKLVFK